MLKALAAFVAAFWMMVASNGIAAAGCVSDCHDDYDSGSV